VSLTIQYKAVTRVDVIPAATSTTFGPPVKEMKGDRLGATERVRGREEGRGGRDIGPPPTIPLAGTVICCMHAFRDG